MKKILTILISLIYTSTFCQTKYEINGFSEKYKGELVIDEGFENEVFKKGEISIFEIGTKKKILTIKSDEFTLELDNEGKVETNIIELPYGKQSIIIYEDFNFDDKKDLAVMDGQNSCYHGPSFQIYLETNDGLQHSPHFTRLAQEYCGMFQIDSETKTIYTMTKSGCCWHQRSEFKIKENTPISMKIVERGLSMNGLTEDYVEKNRVGDTLVEEKYSYIAEESDIIEVYSMTFKNGKKMELYRAFEDYLIYTFTDIDKKIELLYLDTFVYNKKENTLTFVNKNVEYKVYSGGILVTTPKRTVDLKAKRIGENVTLTSLSSLSSKLKNIIIE
jgi:hypothetical protein